MAILFLIIFLPLLEISGFVVIGGKIGLGLSLLWVIAATLTGFYLLATMDGQTLQKARKAAAAEAYPFEEMFDGLCTLLGALLLIFPGFVSDLMALPLLIAPLRHGIFNFLKYRHKNVLNNLSKNTQGFTYWYYEERKNGKPQTIEGSFKRLDKNNEE
jgi:UPF0716 protein FxsA